MTHLSPELLQELHASRTRAIDNQQVLNQDCSRPLFRWFLSRIDWKRILKTMTRNPHA